LQHRGAVGCRQEAERRRERPHRRVLANALPLGIILRPSTRAVQNELDSDSA